MGAAFAFKIIFNSIAHAQAAFKSTQVAINVPITNQTVYCPLIKLLSCALNATKH
jgi:hypothetical protein